MVRLCAYGTPSPSTSNSRANPNPYILTQSKSPTEKPGIFLYRKNLIFGDIKYFVYICGINFAKSIKKLHF